jgi:WD40 repeat protein
VRRITVLVAATAMLLMAANVRAQNAPEVVATIATDARVNNVLLAPTGRVVAAFCSDDKLRVLSVPQGAIQQTIDVAGRQFTASAISADGRLIAAGDFAGNYNVWDTSSGTVRISLKSPYYPSAMAFTADGTRLAMAPVGEPVQIYDMGSGKKLLELRRVTGGTAAISFSRDGRRIATADADTVVRIYDASTGALLSANAEYLLEPLSAVFSADGSQVITGGGDKVVVWHDAQSGKSIRRSGKTDDPVAQLGISPDGKMVSAALMHADNLLMPAPILVSEVDSGKRVSQWMPPSLPLGGGWVSDGRLLIVTGDEKAIQLWRVR